jgi:hypothetical protein
MNRILHLAAIAVLVGGCNSLPLQQSQFASQQESASVQKPRGFMQLIEFHDDIQGVRNWACELEQRGNILKPSKGGPQ